jgi:hypothetical protein
MSKPEPGTDSWLEQVQEDIIEPDRPIIDPHHHLWMKRFGRDYLLEQLWRDTGSGHNVVKTLFMECSAFYLREGQVPAPNRGNHPHLRARHSQRRGGVTSNYRRDHRPC